MKKLIYTLVFIFILSQTLLSQVTWQQCAGVYGGEVRCFAVASNGNVYMGSNGSGIYKTTDSGDNWAKVNTGILNLNVRAMAINTSDHIFTGILDNSGSGILRSTNSGVNWYYTPLVNNDIRTIALNSTGHIFVGMDTMGIYRSTDNGVSFTQVNNGLNFRKIRSIAINSSGVIFAAAYTGGVFRSTDNGGNWTLVNTGLTNLYVNAIAVNPVNGYIFVGTGNGYFSGKIYRSTNNGAIWTVMPFDENWVLTLAINPTGTIYAGTQRTSYATPLTYVYKSSDGGGTWDLIGAEGTQAGLNTMVINNTLILFGTNYTLYRSVNNGSFSEINNGFTGQFVTSLFIKNPDNFVFAGTNWAGIKFTSDGGINWNSSGSVYANYAFSINSFGLIHSAGSWWDYNVLKPVVRKSTDNGLTWYTLNFPSNLQGSVLSLTINYLDYIFAGTTGNGILRSVDNGINWATINLSNNNVYSLLSVDSTATIFAGTGGGKIFRSTDNGFGWDQVYISPITTNSVRSLANSKTNLIYAGLDSGGIIISTNNGTTWTQSGFPGSHVNVIAFNSLNHIFAGTGNNGVYRSTNDGVNWAQVNNGFTTNNRINALAIDSAGFIYSGHNGGGIYKSLQSTTISIKEISIEVPSEYSLSQNYPNPFNPVTNIKFSIQKSSFVKIIIYDAMGREIQTIVNESLQHGTYETSFDGSNYSSGVYFYILTAGNYAETKRMVLIK